MDSYIISGVATYRRSFWLVSGIQSVQNGSYKGTKDKLDLKKTAFYGTIRAEKQDLRSKKFESKASAIARKLFQTLFVPCRQKRRRQDTKSQGFLKPPQINERHGHNYEKQSIGRYRHSK